MHGNVHAIFAAIWRRTGFPATECNRWRNHYEPASKCQKHGVETHIITQNQEIQVCLLQAKWCWCCFGTLMDPVSSITRTTDRWSILCYAWRGAETHYMQ